MVCMILLGIYPALLQILPPALLATAAGPVARPLIFLEARLLDTVLAPISNWVIVEAAVVNNNPNRERCSGMFIRTILFTATAPDGQGLLHIAARKNGIVSHIPVV
jgi:hypothetical protein